MLRWPTRQERILANILLYAADIVCLEEVDHFHDYFSPKLKEHGYRGIFLAKPDSPCLRVPGYNSPDGCSVFVKEDRLEILEQQEIVLKNEQDLASNQVAIIVILNDLQTKRRLLAAVTHLKAKEGNERIRLVQGKELLLRIKQIQSEMESCAKPLPSLVCGDFNATPEEPVCQEMVQNCFKSAHVSAAKLEAPFTTWKYRPKGQVCHTIDYVWHSSEFTARNFLQLPSKNAIGETALPTADFPSDHLSLVFDFSCE